tara:strand:+ start:2088 stop:3143 length:1056 start_codon:yes stop_codon:yes gene_type:complete
MAHIFKKSTNNTKGIIVLTHQEVDFIMSTPETHEKVRDLFNKNFIGVHYGGFSFGATPPPFCSFYMGLPSVTDIKQRHPNIFNIPLASGNFTSSVFKEDKRVFKYWDIINVSRNGNVKNLRKFFTEIKKLYSLGYNYKVLLVCASRNEETPEDHFVDISDVYYDMFSKEERDMFTLLRLGKDLEFKGLSKKQLAFFYQSSKVMTLFSEVEGFPGVIPEALLTGVPVVIWEGQKGSGKDYLNCDNSKLFNTYDEAHKSLIDAVEDLDNFSFNFEELRDNLNDEKSLLKLKGYFKDLYNNFEQSFDGELINTDDLVSRLPAHYVDLPWVSGRDGNGHVKSMEAFNVLYEEIQK